jgi:hypothetical protein
MFVEPRDLGTEVREIVVQIRWLMLDEITTVGEHVDEVHRFGRDIEFASDFLVNPPGDHGIVTLIQTVKFLPSGLMDDVLIEVPSVIPHYDDWLRGTE